MKSYIKADETKNWLKDLTNVDYTTTFKQADVEETNDKGRKILKSGAIYPANDGTAIGIVLNEVDVTGGDAIGSLMVRGAVIESRLPETLSSTAKEALMKLGIQFYKDDGIA